MKGEGIQGEGRGTRPFRTSLAAFACAAAAFAGSGCATTTIPGEQLERARTQTELRNAQADIQRLQGRLDELDVRWREMQAHAQSRDDRDANAREAWEKRLQALAEQIRRVDAARESDRAETIERLSAKMAELINRYSGNGGASARPPGGVSSPGGGSAAAGEAVSHVVARGETMSGIAQKYGVTVSAILQANSIANVNLIRTGQRLAIPR